MAEYIEREALEKNMNERLAYLLDKNGPYDDFTDGYDEAVSTVEEFLSADVAPVRHGRWMFGKDLPYNWGQIPKNKYHLYCSECSEQAINRSGDNDPDFDVDTPYCPFCGCCMDGGVDE